MNSIVDALSDLLLDLGLCTSPATQQQIIFAQKELFDRHLPALPKDFAELLKFINTFEYNGVALFGINNHSYLLDVVAENSALDLGNDILVLGRDEFSYLVYDSSREQYQILDQQSLQSVKNCKNLEQAIRYLFKL